MLTAVLLVLLALATLAAVALAVVRGRRLAEARDAVATLARAWSEDGSSRGRVCAAAAHAAGARLALLVQPTLRGDALTVTATAEAPEAVGTTLPLDERVSPVSGLRAGRTLRAHAIPPSSRGSTCDLCLGRAGQRLQHVALR